MGLWANFSSETSKARRQSAYIFEMLKEKKLSTKNPTQAYLILLHFTDGTLLGFLINWRPVATVSSKSTSTVFLTAFFHFMSVCHILVILKIFQGFPLLCLLQWSEFFSNETFYIKVGVCVCVCVCIKASIVVRVVCNCTFFFLHD